jgi:hypothetical protein
VALVTPDAVIGGSVAIIANCPIPPCWLVVFELVDAVVLEPVDLVEPVLALLMPVVLVVLAIADVLVLL